MKELKKKNAFISDMDGVIYHGNRLFNLAVDFVEWLRSNKKKYLFLTNSSERTPRELREKLQRLGMDVPEDNFYTSAMATADFLSRSVELSVFAIGEAGLTITVRARYFLEHTARLCGRGGTRTYS